MPNTIIIGAGISGLTCAYELRKRGEDLIVLDAALKPGGVMQSERVDGYLVENGPNSLRGNLGQMTSMLDELGLTARMSISSPDANKRYILRGGKAVVLPRGPFDAVSTPVLGMSGKLRALREPWIKATAEDDLPVAEFFTRRVGAEVTEYLVGPFVSGIYAGDPERLSMKATFPKLWELEQRSGSIIRGAIAQRRSKKRDGVHTNSAQQQPPKTKGIFSFTNGLSELPLALASTLGDRLSLGAPVERITKAGTRFVIEIAGSTLHTERLILATPTYVAANLLRGITPEAANQLDQLSYAPIVALHLGFDNGQFAQPPVGFGLLVPQSEKRDFLGVIYSSSLFAGRAPQGKSLLTVLIGGATRPELTELEDAALMKIVLPQLADLYHITGAPEFIHLRRWKRAIPQYNLGYEKVIEAVRTAELQHPGLHFIGSYRGGISVNDCVKNATELAAKLV